MVFSGSLVNHGTGKYIVCAIGMQTEIGKIASLLDNTKNRKTPLQKNLDTLSGQLSLLILRRCGQFLGPKGTRRRKTWHIRNKKKNELSPYMMN